MKIKPFQNKPQIINDNKNKKYFPNIDYKRNWDGFFSELSRNNRGIFKNISACVYLSETSFKNKQVSSINTALKSLSNSPLEMASP